MSLYFYWFCCVARSRNSLLTTDNALLSKINNADLLLAHRKGRWTFRSYLLLVKYLELMCTYLLS